MRVCARLFMGFLTDFWWQERQAIGQWRQAMSNFDRKAEIPWSYPKRRFDPHRKSALAIAARYALMRGAETTI